MVLILKKITLAIAIALFIAACAGTKVPTGPTQANVEKGKAVYSDLTLENLIEGKALYEKSCASCHKLYDPQSESAVGWKKIVPPMSRKARIDSKAEEQILKYLITMSLK